MRKIQTKTAKVLQDETDCVKWANKYLMYKIASRSYQHFMANEFVEIPFQTINTWLARCGIPKNKVEQTKKLFREKKLIEVNDSYSTSHHKCKSYKIPDTFISASFFEHFVEDVIVIQNHYLKSDRKASECNTKFFEREVERYYRKSLQALSFSEEFKASLPYTSNNGEINYSYSDYLLNVCENNLPRYCIYKNYRVFSTFNSIPRTMREHCLLNGGRLAELDAKTLHPRILAFHSDDAALLATVKEQDIYEVISAHLGLHGRDEAKRPLLRYLNCSLDLWRFMEEQMRIDDLFKQQYPKARKFLYEQKKDDHRNAFQFFVEQEWKVIHPWVKKLKKNNIPSLTLFDGVAVEENKVEQALSIADKELPSYIKIVKK